MFIFGKRIISALSRCSCCRAACSCSCTCSDRCCTCCHCDQRLGGGMSPPRRPPRQSPPPPGQGMAEDGRPCHHRRSHRHCAVQAEEARCSWPTKVECLWGSGVATQSSPLASSQRRLGKSAGLRRYACGPGSLSAAAADSAHCTPAAAA